MARSLPILSSSIVKADKLTLPQDRLRRDRPWPTVTDFNTGKTAIGTGPFLMKSYVKGTGHPAGAQRSLLGREAPLEDREDGARAQRRPTPDGLALG